MESKCMLTIDRTELGKNAGRAVEYLRSRLDEPVKVNRSQVKLTQTGTKTAKLLLYKFLRQLRLEGYRVLSVNPGLIIVHAPEKKMRQP